MEVCCSNNLGKFPHNKPVDTGILLDPGTYTILIEGANDDIFELEKEIEAGEKLIFDIGELNENMIYKFQIRKEDDSLYTLNNCTIFKLKTFINTKIDGCTDNCDDADDNGTYSPY